MANTESPTYKLVAERVGRDTIEFFEAERAAGKSWRAISLALFRDHDLDVTEVTMRKWWDDAAAEAEEPAEEPAQ